MSYGGKVLHFTLHLDLLLLALELLSDFQLLLLYKTTLLNVEILLRLKSTMNTTPYLHQDLVHLVLGLAFNESHHARDLNRSKKIKLTQSTRIEAEMSHACSFTSASSAIFETHV